MRSLHVTTALLLTALLAGCGGSGGDDPTTDRESVTAPPTSAAETTTAPSPTTTAGAATTDATATATTAAAAPATIDIDYQTGSIPPPYNYELTLLVELGADAATADYALTYRYRDALPEDSTEPVDEDVRWSGVLDTASTDLARGLVDDPDLTGTVDEDAVGGDSWEVEVQSADGETQTGVPGDPERYRALICAVDGLARQAPGATKAQYGPC